MKLSQSNLTDYVKNAFKAGSVLALGIEVLAACSSVSTETLNYVQAQGAVYNSPGNLYVNDKDHVAIFDPDGSLKVEPGSDFNIVATGIEGNDAYNRLLADDPVGKKAVYNKPEGQNEKKIEAMFLELKGYTGKDGNSTVSYRFSADDSKNALRMYRDVTSDNGGEGSNPGDCFAAGTLVLTKNGFVPIENIGRNDIVVGYSSKDGRALDLGMGTVESRVAKTYGPNSSKLGELYSINGIKVTAEHPYFTPDGKQVKAKDLNEGDKVLGDTDNDPDTLEEITIGEVGIMARKEQVFNLTSQDTHNFIVAVTPDGQRFLVHNKGESGGNGGGDTGDAD